MDSSQLNWIAKFIWGIADDVLRDLYVPGEYHSGETAEAEGFLNAAADVTASD